MCGRRAADLLAHLLVLPCSCSCACCWVHVPPRRASRDSATAIGSTRLCRPDARGYWARPPVLPPLLLSPSLGPFHLPHEHLATAPLLQVPSTPLFLNATNPDSVGYVQPLPDCPSPPPPPPALPPSPPPPLPLPPAASPGPEASPAEAAPAAASSGGDSSGAGAIAGGVAGGVTALGECVARGAASHRPCCFGGVAGPARPEQPTRA